MQIKPDFDVVPEPRITLFPRDGLKMRLQKRLKLTYCLSQPTTKGHHHHGDALFI
jgi:hypothetical protein